MFEPLRKGVLSWLRRLVGTARLLEDARVSEERAARRFEQQRALLIAIGNGIASNSSGAGEITASAAYQRCALIVRELAPADIEGGQFVRIGRDYDGGYIMLDGFGSQTTDAAFAFGVGRDASWEAQVADRGIDVYMFDHTVEQPPMRHQRCHFVPLGVTGTKRSERLRTLERLVSDHGMSESKRLMLKMDIEGAEWDVLEQASSSTLDQFTQIVIEFHRLVRAVYRERELERVIRVLRKLNITHQCVHVHGNTNVPRPPVWLGNLVLPDALEVTYVCRRDFTGRMRPNTRYFPTALDQPSHPGRPDLHLGTFGGSATR
jgi:hypothetical protein